MNFLSHLLAKFPIPSKESWRDDPDKLTFIILSHRSIVSTEQSSLGTPSELRQDGEQNIRRLFPELYDQKPISKSDQRLHEFDMIGDVNVFFHGPWPWHTGSTIDPSTNPSALARLLNDNFDNPDEIVEDTGEEQLAELEIMIAGDLKTFQQLQKA